MNRRFVLPTVTEIRPTYPSYHGPPVPPPSQRDLVRESLLRCARDEPRESRSDTRSPRAA